MAAIATRPPADRTGIDAVTSLMEAAELARDGLCAGQSALFFPTYNERPGARALREARAKALCAQCPVREACRSYGRRHAEYGIWGGETEEERALAGVELPYPFSPKTLKRLRDALD